MCVLSSVRTVHMSQILKIFNGSCSIENFGGYDQVIKVYMTKVLYFCFEAFFRKFLIHYGGPPLNDVCHRKRHLSRESEDNCFNKSEKQMKNIVLLLNTKTEKNFSKYQNIELSLSFHLIYKP